MFWFFKSLLCKVGKINHKIEMFKGTGVTAEQIQYNFKKF